MGQGWCTLIYGNKTTKCTFYTDVLTSGAGVELIHSKLFDFFFHCELSKAFFMFCEDRKFNLENVCQLLGKHNCISVLKAGMK